MNIWIKAPRSNQPDATLTIAVYASIAVLVKFLLNGVTIGNFSFGTVDATLVGAVLTPTLMAYVARKHKTPPEKEKSE